MMELRIRRLVLAFLRTSRTLYHGTLIDHKDSILKHGLWPSVGAFVEDMYACSYDEGHEFPELVFSADKQSLHKVVNAILHHVGKKIGKYPGDVTEQDIKEHGMLVVIKEGERQMIQRPDRKRAWDAFDNYPDTVEPGDWYSDDGVGVDYVLTGSKLVQFLRKNRLYPDRARWEHDDNFYIMRIMPVYTKPDLNGNPGMSRQDALAKLKSMSSDELANEYEFLGLGR